MKLTRKFIREACLPLEIYSYLINIASTLENIFLDEIVLSKSQEATLNNMLKDYPLVKDLFIKEGLIEEDRNPFKKDLSCEDIKNLNTVLHNVFEVKPLAICYGAENNILTGERGDLYKRALYVIPGYEVLLHTTKHAGTVIELQKSE
jgi:hypothetical protein